MPDQSFSERYGFSSPPREILYRDELPVALRTPIVKILRDYNSDSSLNNLVAEIFDPYGIDPPLARTIPMQAAYRESDDAFEFRRFLSHCEWYRIYEFIEVLIEHLEFHERELADPEERARAVPMQRDLNAYFVHAGIGWQLDDNGKVVTRGDRPFEQTVSTAIAVLEEAARPTAAAHLGFAIAALSTRPKANTSGAVAQATSAVECVLGQVTGETMTLGKYLDRHPGLFHRALKKGLDGIYGFASDGGARHGKEGTEPAWEDAEFIVATCAAVCTLLTRKHRK